MFTTDQVPAGVLAAITAPDTIDVPEIATRVEHDARRLTDEITAGRNLSDDTRNDIYYGLSEAMFHTILDRVADRDGDDEAGRLAAAIDSYLDATA